MYPQLWSKEEGDIHLREIKDSVRSLRSEVRAELDNSLKELAMQPIASSDTGDHEENHLTTPLAVRKVTYNTKVWHEFYRVLYLMFKQ